PPPTAAREELALACARGSGACRGLSSAARAARTAGAHWPAHARLGEVPRSWWDVQGAGTADSAIGGSGGETARRREGEGRRAWEFRRRPRSGPLPIHGWGGGEAARQRGVQAANSGAVARCETAANVGPPGLFVTVLSLQILLLIITLLRLESVGRPSSQLGAAAGALAKPLVNYLSATVRLRDWYPPRQAQWAGRHYVR
ncbi:unnamed protein product, partial [Prorocentrum cordatum]